MSIATSPSAPRQSIPSGRTTHDVDATVVISALEALAGIDTLDPGVPSPAAVLAELRADHPEHRFHLVADREPYDGTEHHGLIVRGPAGRTVSLSVAPAEGLPWPLRGVTRGREYDLVEVDGRTMTVADALAAIDFGVADRPLLRMLVDGCLVDAALDEDPPDVPDAVLRETAASFRHRHGLRRAEDTRRWMEVRGLTSETFTTLMWRHAEVAQFRRRVAGERVEGWFAAHAADMTTVVAVRIATSGSSAPASRRWADLLRDDPLGAAVRARRDGLAAGIEEWRVGELTGWLSPLAAADVGDVIVLDGDGDGDADVAMRGEGPSLVAVVDRRPAVLDAATRAEVVQRLFDDWLDERRRRSRVRWLWGDERVTDAVGDEERR
jgi:putative peptide maturation system protein